MNWDTIKYIFQIPLSWYKSIHDKVFNAYGTNFIKVRDGDDGAMQIDVDEATFNEAVMRVAGGGVRSVDGITPDPDGNIPLGAVRTINNEAPDANGNIDIELSGTVTSVNGVVPGLDGNVNLGDLVYTVNGAAPDEDGNVDVGTVKSVDNIQPDSNGNVSLTGFVKSVNTTLPDLSGNVTVDVGVKSVNLLAPDQTGNVTIPAIYRINGVEPPAYSHNFEGVVFSVNDTAPDAFGNVVLDVGEGSVKSVNGEEPDEDGNVTVDVGVKTVNNIRPDLSGNVEVDVGVKSVDGYLPDPDTGNLDLGVVLAINDQLPDANGDVYLTGFVKSVDSYYPDENGDVDFGLAANKWLKSDTQGHIATTDDVPIIKDTTTKGYIYNNYGTIEYKDEEYVDLTSDQTITGKKTFNNDVAIHNDGSLLVAGSNAGTSVSKNGITITSQTLPFIAFNKPGTAAYDSFITLSPTFNDLNFQSPIGVNIDAPANKAVLAKQPTDTATSSLAIATCGYVQTQALTLSGDQTITGQKTFKKELRVGFDGLRDVNSRTREIQGLRFRDSNSAVVGQLECELGADGTNVLRDSVQKIVGGTMHSAGISRYVTPSGSINTVLGYNAIRHNFIGDCRIEMYCLQSGPSLVFLPKEGTTNGGVIAFRYGGADSHTCRIVEWANYFEVEAIADKYVRLKATANKAILAVAPTVASTDQTSLAIATCGYVNKAVASAAVDTSKFVTINTTQTITGQKTFTAAKTYTNNIEATGSIAATGTVTTGSDSVGKSQLEYGRLYLNRNTPAIYLQNGSYTSLIYMSGTEMRVQNTTGNIQLNGINVYRETTPPDTDATDAKNIPTLGWCNRKFGKVKTVNNIAPDSSGNVTLPLPDGTVKSVDHVSPDNNGNVQINAIRTINGHSGDSVGNFNGVVTSINGQTPTDGAVTLQGLVKSVEGIQPNESGNIVGVATSVDGHAPGEGGAVSFGLANGKWVKTDADGHLTTTDETPIAIDTTQYSPKTVTKKVVTNVVWNGTTLVYKSENWQFVKGVLVNVTANNDTVIDTPVAYSAT